MNKLFILAAVIAALAFSSVAFADNPAGINYDTLHAMPADNAQCGTAAGSGAFAAFGNFSTVHDFSGGADGYQTGLNNSSVCGNR
jgi:acyl-homoserine lactone acylase PvdQ